MLVRLQVAQPSEKPVTLDIDANETTVQLRARVVRCVPHRVELPGATLARMEYHVGLEFFDVSSEVTAALMRIIRKD